MAGSIEIFLYTPPLDPKKIFWGVNIFLTDPHPHQNICVWGGGQYIFIDTHPPSNKYSINKK